MFAVHPTSEALPPKERVLGVWYGGSYRAYPESAFSTERTTVEAELGGKRVAIDWIPASKTLRVASADEGVHWMYSLWFSWYAMYPETTVYERPDGNAGPEE